MDTRPSFESIWNRNNEFDPDRDPLEACINAIQFALWADLLFEGLTTPSVVSVNQGKVLLIDKYFEWRRFVPKSHRNRVGPGGHRCIYHVFEQTYERLKVIELALTPPMLFLPPPPTPRLPPQVGGIFLGEVVED